ncbi:uncharacterized protein Dana_GF20713, isoform A [Drosophila ananassae]|uniref:Uncharacterized protein, isoform A n=1 Tax=Drosophila ananassae TaxID=7217 RepID=B3N1Q4_DROAN|nr:uncharacterized protein Dana_GF20713, isoform A [Drosophila ananassae]
MSTTWQMLPLFFCKATLLGLCQSESVESLDVFAPATSHEAAKVNNVTLPPPGLVTKEETDFDQDPLTPHAAPLSQRKLSRGKRFVAFPVGSSASVAVCFTVGIIGNPNYAYNSFGLNWGTAYDLPNTSWVLQNLHGFSTHPVAPAVLRRRSRRALYQRIETIIDNMGYDGRNCILRTLCESRKYFQKTKMNMIGEMLRVIFSLPKQRLYSRELHENADIVHYDRAYRNGYEDDCLQYNCHFSLIELAFGKYSTPPKNYYA